MNLLFICSRNQWRSPTAEALFGRVPGLQVRSRGTSSRARRTVTAQDIAWADTVMVMEREHLQRLRGSFARELAHKRTHVLEIPDDYRFMDDELVELLEASVWPLLEDDLEKGP